jgi:riboflavin kinase/FMN adenylyltransferase
LPDKKIFALGFFDGVHLGHQALLESCCNLAREEGALPCAITFQSHPQALFTDTPPLLINSEEDRKQLLARYGIRQVVSYPVTREVMGMPWEKFLEELVADGAVGFVCGQDFRFGHKGAGNAQKLADYCRGRGLQCRILADQTLEGIRVSSSHIRTLLEAGRMEDAVRFLGHPHILSGCVTSGRKLGRTIGVPTANLSIPQGVLQPRPGVYACIARVGGQAYMAVTNVGNRPTVGGHRLTVEPWLLDFSGDLYGQTLTLEFHKFLRPEKKFESLDALKEAILENEQQTRAFFG